MARAATIIGVISDTHGLLRPEAFAALRGSDYLIHAGDIGDPAILEKLNEIAPVTAIRGNIDREAWALKIPATNVLDAGGVSIYVVHNLQQLDLKPESAGFEVVVYGHSHVAKQGTKNGVLYFNPGSAGPRRFRLPVTIGRLTVREGGVSGEMIEIVAGGISRALLGPGGRGVRPYVGGGDGCFLRGTWSARTQAALEGGRRRY